MAAELKLLPCPFCGGKAELSEFEATENHYLFEVFCTECGAEMTDTYQTMVDAITAWNRRPDIKEAGQPATNTGSPKLPDYQDFHLFCDKEGLFPKQAENIYQYIVSQLRAGADESSVDVRMGKD